METITVPKGSYGYDINFTVTGNDGTAVNLSGTVTMNTWRPNDPGTRIFDDESITVDVAASGTCHYTVVTGDFDDALTYVGELVHDAGNGPQPVKVFRLVVTERGAS